MTNADRYPSYRAPRGNREILCTPPWSTISERVLQDRRSLAACDASILGKSLSDASQDARHALLTKSHRYTSSYLDTSLHPVGDDRPLIITGHQPALVHPGVWLKNFAASQLAQQVNGTAINLIIDTDLCRSTSARVPTGTVDQPSVVDLPYDRPADAMPYEERNLVDHSVWSSFGSRAEQALAPLLSNPLLVDWWQEVLQITKKTTNIGYVIAQARHCLEHDWGNHSLEIPFSHVCQSEPFHRFALHLLFQAKQFKKNYNEALAEYRHVHSLRNPAQPLPDLTEVEGWIETPFWVWTADNPTRRPLFIQPRTADLLLSDRLQWQTTLPQNEADGLQCLDQLQQQGLKLRSRALVTTLYTRLLVADTFVHGIGGAKYDQVTNSLCQRFFGVELPGYLTLSGTLQLPITHTTIPASRPNDLRHTLRELRYHPESQLKTLTLDANNQTQAEAWVAQKKHWIEIEKNNDNAAERHRQIVAANNALQAWLQSQKKKLEHELTAALAQNRANLLLESREYPFCLFPRPHLQAFFLDFLGQIP